MLRPNRKTLAVALAAVALLSTFALGGCKKSAPVLTPEQLQAGLIGGEKHPVNQEQAVQMGCSCHIEAAKKAAGGK